MQRRETPEQQLAHVKYEYDMARYCLAEMNSGPTQAQFNVLLAAFGVYFRNSRDFLKNESKRSALTCPRKLTHGLKLVASSYRWRNWFVCPGRRDVQRLGMSRQLQALQHRRKIKKELFEFLLRGGAIPLNSARPDRNYVFKPFHASS
jgi:hypothetical protein